MVTPAPDGQRRARTVFIGRLPLGANSCTIRDALIAAGFPAEHCQVNVDLVTGVSRCFGFARFADEETARRAVEDLDMRPWLGSSPRLIRVQPAF